MNGGFLFAGSSSVWRCPRWRRHWCWLAAVAAAAARGGYLSASATSTAAASAKLSAFQTCLKQHGVTIKPGQFGGRPHASFYAERLPNQVATPAPILLRLCP